MGRLVGGAGVAVGGGRFGAGAHLLPNLLWHLFDDLARDLVTDLPGDLDTCLLWYLLGNIDWVLKVIGSRRGPGKPKYLGTDCLGELFALLTGHIDGEVLAPLVWHLLAFGPWHLLLHLLGHLLAVLLGHLQGGHKIEERCQVVSGRCEMYSGKCQMPMISQRYAQEIPKTGF